MSEETELNAVVVRVEAEYRAKNDLAGRRIRFIPSAFVRERSTYFPPGTKVTSNLIGHLFLWPIYPFGFGRTPDDWYRKEDCPGCRVSLPAIEMSLDHIKPISRGGLELDRSNIRFLCLRCNLSRGPRTLRLRDRRLENHPPLESFTTKRGP